MLTHNDEKERAQELLAGDDVASKLFFDEFFPRLYRFAINRMSGNHEATREVVQSSLAKILLNLNKFKGNSSLFTWMCAICRNEITDYQRTQQKYKQTVLLESEISDPDSVDSTAVGIDSDRPDDVYGRDQKALAIHQVLDNLPSNYGDILEWKYIEGLSVKEMADRLGMSQIAAQSILFRARNAFQAVYTEFTQRKPDTA